MIICFETHAPCHADCDANGVQCNPQSPVLD